MIRVALNATHAAAPYNDNAAGLKANQVCEECRANGELTRLDQHLVKKPPLPTLSQSPIIDRTCRVEKIKTQKGLQSTCRHVRLVRI